MSSFSVSHFKHPGKRAPLPFDRCYSGGSPRDFHFNFKYHFQNGKSSGFGVGGVGTAPCRPTLCPSFFGVNISISYP